MEITLEEIQKKFADLPEALKWAIMGAKVDDNIIDIGQAQGLNVEQMGQLSLEAYMVMLGFTHPDKFEESVRGSLKLSEEKTHTIINAVNEKILKEIRIRMKENPKGEVKSPGIPLKINTIEDKILRHDTDEEKKNNSQILNSAGIEIIPADPRLPDTLQSAGQASGGKEGNNPILVKKLSGPVQTPTVKTQYSLGNITKTTPADAPYPAKRDPYRLPPE